MKKTLLLLTVLCLSIASYAQMDTIKNVELTLSKEVWSRYQLNIDSTEIHKKIDTTYLGSEYTNLKQCLINEFDTIYFVLYQNKSQTFIPDIERIWIKYRYDKIEAFYFREYNNEKLFPESCIDEFVEFEKKLKIIIKN